MGPGRQPKDLAECLAKAAFIGMAEADARDWYRDCAAAEWCHGDEAGTPFGNWVRQMVLHRDHLREKAFLAKQRNGKPATAGNLRIQLEAIDGEIARLTYETANGRYLTDEGNRPQYKDLLARRRELRTRLVNLQQ